ncbi:TraR/DksA C4-type zinc finger protein [Leisingera caerulea]|uniref:TraR/DksA C4-type zinc finger protein n=1 Tax=Leisingera caerulea TaxID=506591 RepID=A0ABY5WZU1_LEICA|nr:TraR/DksA C4-type zinc finger protein [Leisingera caerulea]UWQ50849.1 TraR/DksA C4-type zinc finger protein [Leisingera caerulea]UWQ59545.1 TraR/DksA C4-type zinc finger protein [Leisingera caerulea]
MDFSTRKQTLEVRRTELAGMLSQAGLGLEGAYAAPRRTRAAAPAASAIEVPAKASLDELRRIDAALARLREGSYGFCQICGDDIADDWLDQRPASPFCKSCAL